MGEKEILLVVVAAEIAAALILLAVIGRMAWKRRQDRKLFSETEEEGPKAASGKRPDAKKTGLIIGYSGRCNGKEITLKDGETVSLGRSSEKCRIVAAGSGVSRLHCRITYQAADDSYTIRDFSANGTFLLDGGRISPDKPECVPSGTCIYLGNKEHIFQLGNPV